MGTHSCAVARPPSPFLSLSLPLHLPPALEDITQKNGWIINSNSINEETAAALRQKAPCLGLTFPCKKAGRAKPLTSTHVYTHADTATVCPLFYRNWSLIVGALLKYCKASSHLRLEKLELFRRVWRELERQESSCDDVEAARPTSPHHRWTDRPSAKWLYERICSGEWKQQILSDNVIHIYRICVQA